jgi:hypothetical protein
METIILTVIAVIFTLVMLEVIYKIYEEYIQKNKYLKTIFVLIVSFFTIAGAFTVITGEPIIALFKNNENQVIENLIKAPNTTAVYSLKRVNDKQIYFLSVVNDGSTFANRLRIQIGFHENMTISDLDYHPKQTYVSSDGGKGENHFHIIFLEIQVGEEATVELELTNVNFTDNNTWVVEPEYQNVWTADETIVEIEQVNEEEMIFY